MKTFEWNEVKAASNRRKHGVTFVEAVEVFSDWAQATIPDSSHSTEENRFITIGMSYRFQLLVVVHVDTDATIRIISARTATRRERETYEEERDRPERR